MTHLCCKKLRPSQCLGVCVCVICKSVYVRLMRTWQRVFVSARVHFVSLVCIWSIYLCFRVHITFRYPDYEFISDNSISWSAGLHNRYTENSLRGVILDIHFLSQTDFLVCTFSSQVSSRFPVHFWREHETVSLICFHMKLKVRMDLMLGWKQLGVTRRADWNVDAFRHGGEKANTVDVE